MNRLPRFALLMLLGASTLFAESVRKLPRVPAAAEKVFEIIDGRIWVPLDEAGIDMVRADLMRQHEQKSDAFSPDFDKKILAHAGLSRHPKVWIFSTSSGELASIAASDLKFENTGGRDEINSMFVDTDAPIDCPSSDCLVIAGAKSPFKPVPFKRVALTDLPGHITLKELGIDASRYDAVRLSYAKRPNGAELVTVQTYKVSPQTPENAGGINTEDIGLLRAGDTWQEVYTRSGFNSDLDLSKTNVATLGRPVLEAGVPAAGDEVLLIEYRFIFLNGKSASVMHIPDRNEGHAACGC